MATNQEKLDGAFWAVTLEGRDFADRHTFSETKYPNAWGHQFTLLEIINGIERRVAEQNAQIGALASAVSVATTNPDITPELLQQTLRDALAGFELTLAPKKEG